MAGRASLLASYTVAKTTHPCKSPTLSRQAHRMIGNLSHRCFMPACLVRKPRDAPLIMLVVS